MRHLWQTNSNSMANSMNSCVLIAVVCGHALGHAETLLANDEPTVVPVSASMPLPLELQPITVSLPPDETRLSPEVTNFIKGMALLLLPSTYTDDDDWNLHKRVQSGLNVEFDGLKLDTSRRWKDVRHGTWRRVDATLVDPENHFRLAISLLPRTDIDEPRYRIRAKMRLRAIGRQQRWNFGAQLYSVSADIVADVSFHADLHFQTQLIKTDNGTQLRVLPEIETANARVDGFSLRSVSHVKGGAVREFGNVVEAIVQRAVRKKSEKLPAKINGKIQKKPERFEIPAGILALAGGVPLVAPAKP